MQSRHFCYSMYFLNAKAPKSNIVVAANCMAVKIGWYRQKGSGWLKDALKQKRVTLSVFWFSDVVWGQRDYFHLVSFHQSQN